MYMRIRLSQLMGIVGLFAFSLTCLLFASTPLNCMPISIYLVLITIGPIAIIYRLGEKRAFWIGATICGASFYFACFWRDHADLSQPRLFTTSMLHGVFKKIIPTHRQSLRENEMFQNNELTIRAPYLDDSEILKNIHDERFDVMVKIADGTESCVATDVRIVATERADRSLISARVLVDNLQDQEIKDAQKKGLRLGLRQRTFSDSLAKLRSSQVNVMDFVNVGNALSGIVIFCIGGNIGRRFYKSKC
jgi:hypothetical protein